jgi:hypothetical protein
MALPGCTGSWPLEFFGVPLLDGEGPCRTLAEAGPQAIAELVCQELSLAVHNDDGPLGTGGDAETTTVAFFLVYLDDLPLCHKISS